MRRTMLEQLASEETRGANEDAVFEMDGEQSSSTPRSRAISWAEQITEPEDMEPNEALSSPSASSPSDQESPDPIGSGSFESLPGSPLVINAEKEGATSEIVLPPPVVATPASEPLAVPKVAAASQPLAVPASSSLASSTSESPQSSNGPLSSSVTSSRSSPGLWKKIKGATGLRRPASSHNVKR
jgi:hypothetical protein